MAFRTDFAPYLVRLQTKQFRHFPRIIKAYRTPLPHKINKNLTSPPARHGGHHVSEHRHADSLGWKHDARARFIDYHHGGGGRQPDCGAADSGKVHSTNRTAARRRSRTRPVRTGHNRSKRRRETLERARHGVPVPARRLRNRPQTTRRTSRQSRTAYMGNHARPRLAGCDIPSVLHQARHQRRGHGNRTHHHRARHAHADSQGTQPRRHPHRRRHHLVRNVGRTRPNPCHGHPAIHPNRLANHARARRVPCHLPTVRDATYESTENRPSPVPFPYGKCEHVIANAHATDHIPAHLSCHHFRTVRT